MRWLKQHAHYDDTHPWEALEIVCSLIGADAEPKYVTLLGRCIANSDDYMSMSLDHCLRCRDAVPAPHAVQPSAEHPF